MRSRIWVASCSGLGRSPGGAHTTGFSQRMARFTIPDLLSAGRLHPPRALGVGDRSLVSPMAATRGRRVGPAGRGGGGGQKSVAAFGLMGPGFEETRGRLRF